MSLNTATLPINNGITLPQAEYEELASYQGQFDVVCYQVIYKSERVLNESLSPLYATEQQAIDRKALLIESYPTARISKQVFFHSSENEEGREHILKQIVSPATLLQV